MTDPAADPLARLAAAGVSIWLDDLSRELLDSGDLDRLIADRGVVGVTTNPTIFAGALAKGDRYDEQLRQLARRGASVADAVFEITTDDVRRACDVFAPVYEATEGLDGRVSIEVDPGLAHQTEATVSAAERLWAAVDRPNLLVKIPATEAGLPAITAALAQGISVNVTLIFSLDRYRAVMNAYLAGLEQAKSDGRDLSRIASVASFFVSRVDTEVDKRLDALPADRQGPADGVQPAADPAQLRGRAAIANARLAYHAYEEQFASARWRMLAEAGARPQRPLWASTGVKDPSYPPTLYVTELVAPGTVSTMPSATLSAVAEYRGFPAGVPAPDTVRGDYDQARAVLDDLERLGIGYADVTATLEREGVQKFERSWQELQGTVADELDRLGAQTD